MADGKTVLTAFKCKIIQNEFTSVMGTNIFQFGPSLQTTWNYSYQSHVLTLKMLVIPTIQ